MESNKSSVVQLLKEMGFADNITEKAYDRADIKTVEGVINFIDAHPNLENEPDQPANKMDEESIPKESPGESISAHVNQVWVHELVSAGNTKDVAEKAIFMTQSASVEAAKQWIEEHRGDADFSEPLFIVRPQKSNLTPEEAKKKAKELQAKIREDRAKKDKQAELESEIMRLKSGKNLTQATREFEEMQTKLEMEKLKKDREEKERAKQKILDEIEKDRHDRGLKPLAQIRKPIKELYPDIVKKMNRVYPDPEIVKVCLKTISIYLSKLR